MNPLFKKAKDLYVPGCVSVIYNTHRTKPDYHKDPLVLKNLLKTAESRLLEVRDKKQTQAVMQNLEKLSETIDHSHNLESMVIFANTDFADFVRLPISVTDRVVVDNTFATRELIRALHQEANYYVLVISRERARLIEAFNEKVVKEFDNPFPVTNDLVVADKLKMSMGKAMDQITEEWFNRVDKLLQNALKEEPMPVILATESRNADYYRKIADQPQWIYGHINRTKDDEKAHAIVADAWPVIRAILKEQHQKRLTELQQAADSGKALSDFSEIWRALKEGRGQTLFVKKGYFQPALVNGIQIKPIAPMADPTPDYIQDIIDEMIELNISFGGDAVFVSDDSLASYQNLALVVRY
jgi:hypothetical protein